jgi:hypothetical protein
MTDSRLRHRHFHHKQMLAHYRPHHRQLQQSTQRQKQTKANCLLLEPASAE